MKYFLVCILGITCSITSIAQKAMVKFVQEPGKKAIDVLVDGKPFTTFLYPDTLEKPVLYPLHAANGTIVTRGFPIKPIAGEPTDHPHHLGTWFNYENVNGLDFWNNSYAIPADKKHSYGWIKTDKVLETKDGKFGKLSYHANWVNQQNDVLLEENTEFVITGNDNERVIDRTTVLKAVQEVHFKDAKDGMLGLRLAHELQIPSKTDQKFTDDKGNVTVVKGGTDNIANGNYLTSAGKTGDDAWSTRGKWCEVFGKMGKDSISIVILDHPMNPNYPTFWHARGYGLFAANPLGEAIFTNGKSEKNLQLKKGESVTFRYQIIITNGQKTLSVAAINDRAADFK